MTAPPVPGARWHALIASAIRAPSPHNVQPWRVKVVDDGNAELWIERRRTLPKEDVTGSFILLTMGLFIETLRIVAAARGLELGDDPVHDPSWYAAEHLESMREPLVPFARLRLANGTAPGTGAESAAEVDRLLDLRRTSRLAYRPEPVNAGAAARLAAAADRWGHRYTQIVDPSRIERMLGWNIDAVFEDLNHAPYHDEMAEWIRYGDAASARHRDGLDARCMNVPPHELWLTFHAPGLLRWPVLRTWFRRRYRAQIGPVATLGVLSGRFWDPADAFRAGRCLIHVWLEVTRLGLHLHPYGNLVTNRPVAARVVETIGIPDPWLVFKIGTSDPPPASLRRTVGEVLL